MPRLRLQELAKERGLNISQIQRQAGLEMGMVRRYWYNEGTRGPLTEVNLVALAKLAEVLEVRLSELIEDDPEEIHSPALAAAF